MTTIFLRAVAADDKATALRELISPTEDERAERFDVTVDSFSVIPRTPFAYWVSSETRELFRNSQPFGSSGRSVKVGLQTSDDSRFLRSWWEPPAETLAIRRWIPFVKGGSFSPFYADHHLVVNWATNGSEIRAFRGSFVRNDAWYFRPGLTYPARPHTNAWFSTVPAGCVFAHIGPVAFVPDREFFGWLALLNSRPFHALAQLMIARGQAGSGQTLAYEVGVIELTPVPDISNERLERLSALARRAWSLMRVLDRSREASHAFEIPVRLNSLPVAVESELSSIQRAIEALSAQFYGSSIGASGSTDGRLAATGYATDLDEPERHPKEDVTSSGDQSIIAVDLLSWCVGVAFGRFDVRLATGEREAPPEPDPFDRLPVCSPGMLTGEDGLPLAAPPEGYAIAWPEDGVLVDDPGHPRDLTGSVRQVFEVVFGDEADAFWSEAAELVDPKVPDIRRWVQRSFFSEHIKRYSKSRRKAPIYWQLGTPSASYSVWLYAHRIGRDSLYQVLNDFVSPKLQAEERKYQALLVEAGPNPSSAQRKELAAQESFVQELRVLRDEVAAVAPLWSPDLNDGVVIVTAPLWRLVPQLKSWQKELKTHWEALCVGKYDWAQLAMHLWPERVIPNCAEDRSLAIAHDLEEVFWEQDADGKWVARKEPARAIDKLVAERTSPAVKDALDSVVSA